MKTISSAIIYQREWQQAMIQCMEYSLGEARSERDKRKKRNGQSSC